MLSIIKCMIGVQIFITGAHVLCAIGLGYARQLGESSLISEVVVQAGYSFTAIATAVSALGLLLVIVLHFTNRESE